MTTVTRADIVRFVEEQAKLSRAAAMVAVETILTRIVDTLRAGEKVELRGFGSFRVRERRGRVGRGALPEECPVAECAERATSPGSCTGTFRTRHVPMGRDVTVPGWVPRSECTPAVGLLSRGFPVLAMVQR